MMVSSACQKFKSWLEKRSFQARKLRGTILGTMLTIVACEIFCYRMLQVMVKSGTLPTYGPDLIIVVFAMLETLTSAFLSWFGYSKRRSVIIATLTALLLSLFSWILMPSVTVPVESEFCHGHNNSVSGGMDPPTAIRLTILLCNCMLILVARVVLWCHGIAYIEEHGPERLGLHLGVLIFARVTVLTVGPHTIGLVVSKGQMIGFTVGLLVNVVQVLLCMPSSTLKETDVPKIPPEGRSFCTSVGRVLSNPLAFTQILSLSLLSTGVWGYSYNATEIIKVKFLIDKRDEYLFFTELFPMFIILMSVLYIGLRWSTPILPQFCKLRAIKQSAKTTLLVGILFVILTVTLKCEHGRVGGMEGGLYNNPSCSLECGCSVRWREVSPVCVVDDMTTYLSPCQAGCGGVDNEGGLMVYKNCTCSASGRAVAGACAERDCEAARSLQRILYVILLTFSVLAFQAHLTLLLKVADPRDKSVTLGLAGAFIALFAFVLGHTAYCGIHWATCIWWEAEGCHMNSPQLPSLVGGASAFLAFASAAICISTFVCLKVQERKREQATRL